MANEIQNVIEQLSGKTSYGKPKAYFTLTHSISGTDGSIKDVDSIFIEKPEIRIFRTLEFTTIDFVYDFSSDADLSQQWEFIQKFLSPENSCFYEDEEIAAMHDEEGNLKETLYMHVLVLSIVDNTTNGKYSFENMFGNMVASYLVPKRPKEEATILRMLFKTEDVLFVEMEDEILKELQHSAMKEAETETMKQES